MFWVWNEIFIHSFVHLEYVWSTVVAKNGCCCVTMSVSHLWSLHFCSLFTFICCFSDKTFHKIFRKLAAGVCLSSLFFLLDSRIVPLKHYWGQPQCSVWALWCCPIRPGLPSALSFILDAVNAAQCSAYHNKAAHVTCPILCTSFCFKRSRTWCVKAEKGLDFSRGVIKFKSLHFIDHWPS